MLALDEYREFNLLVCIRTSNLLGLRLGVTTPETLAPIRRLFIAPKRTSGNSPFYMALASWGHCPVIG